MTVLSTQQIESELLSGSEVHTDLDWGNGHRSVADAIANTRSRIYRIARKHNLRVQTSMGFNTMYAVVLPQAPASRTEEARMITEPNGAEGGIQSSSAIPAGAEELLDDLGMMRDDVVVLLGEQLACQLVSLLNRFDYGIYHISDLDGG